MNAIEVSSEVEKIEETEIAVVIPALNEEKSIGQVLCQIYSSLKNYNHKILVVDGYSKDQTALIAANNGATVIFQRDHGYGDALFTGFLYVKNNFNPEVIVILDGDLTYSPYDIPRLVEPIFENKADFVIGNRFEGMANDAMPYINKIGNKILSWIARRIIKVNVHDTQCGIRAFRTDLIDMMDLSDNGMAFATEMLAEAKFVSARITETPVSYMKRIGKTKLNPIRDGLKILGTILRLNSFL